MPKTFRAAENSFRSFTETGSKCSKQWQTRELQIFIANKEPACFQHSWNSSRSRCTESINECLNEWMKHAEVSCCKSQRVGRLLTKWIHFEINKNSLQINYLILLFENYLRICESVFSNGEQTSLLAKGLENLLLPKELKTLWPTLWEFIRWKVKCQRWSWTMTTVGGWGDYY